MIGSSIDQFKVIQTLGESPTGIKYLAQHHQTGGRYVLHALRPELIRHDEFKRALTAEVVQLIKMEHPNIVTPTNLLEVENRYYLVYEYVEGRTLDTLLASGKGSLPLDGLIRIFKDVLRGFGFAHTESIVHHLFSPRSIVVNDDSEAKILGFGRVLQKQKERQLNEQQKAHFAAYFSPERFNNPDTSDVRSNIYSLGVLLYQMLTGQLVYEGTTLFELEMAHAQNPLPDPRKANPQMPEGLAAVILKALAKAPEKRFQTALEFYREIEKIENMRRSELFQDDFIKGFGEIDGLPVAGETKLDDSDASEPFNLDQPFGDSMDESPHFPIGTEPPEDPFQKKTVRDERLTPDMFEPPPKTGQSSVDQARELGLGDSEPTDEDSGFNFDLSASDDGNQGPESQAAALGLEGYAPGGSSSEDDFKDFESPGIGDISDLEPEDGGFDFGDPATDDEPAQGVADAFDADQEPSFGIGPSEEASEGFDIPGADVSDWERDFDAKVEEPVRDDMGNFDFGDMPGESLDLQDPSAEQDDFGGFALPGQELPSSQADTKPDFGIPGEVDTSAEPTIADPTMAADRGPSPAPRSFVTDDGAFSFEPADEGTEPSDAAAAPPSMPEIRRPLKGMTDSLEAADLDEPVVSAVRVKKIDKRTVLITAVLAVAAAVCLFLWIRSIQAKSRNEKEIRIIQNMVANRNFDGALDEIQTALARSSSPEHKSELRQLEDQLKQDRAKLNTQIQNLMDRAEEFEVQDMVFADGKNDAVGTYQRILEMDPNYRPAQEALAHIQADKLNEVSELMEEDRQVDALRILAVLAKVFPKDTDIRDRYRTLRDRLVEEKSGTLKAEINQLYSSQKFDEIPTLYRQLNEIEPRSDFLKEMKPALLDTYKTLAGTYRSRQEYEKAIDFYRYALEIDPNAQKISAILQDLKEEEVRYNIEKAQSRLDRANEKKDIKAMYRAAQELNTLDPGNAFASSTLATVNDELNEKNKTADELVTLGQFRKASALYKEIFSIRGDENAKILWRKYSSWAPPAGMCFIPGGNFRMGYTPDIMARPTHNVTLSPFFLDAKEVTNREFQEFVESNPEWHPARISTDVHDGNYLRHWKDGAPEPEDLDKPVTFVSWYAAKAYTEFKGKRLPTEAEWEFAALGGAVGQKYWWGNYSDAKNAIYEFYPEKRPGPVGSFPPNPYGVYEILGNVAEWVEDSYDANFYDRSRDARDPVNTAPGDKVYRGGHYRSRGRDITVYKRAFTDPKTCEPTIGFRCARTSNIR